MSSSLWGWIRALENQILEKLKINTGLRDDCELLQQARNGLKNLQGAHNTALNRQRSRVSSGPFDGNRASQELRSYLTELLERGRSCDGKIEASHSDTEREDRKKQQEIRGIEKEIQRLREQVAQAKILAMQEDSMEENGNA